MADERAGIDIDRAIARYFAQREAEVHSDASPLTNVVERISASAIQQGWLARPRQRDGRSRSLLLVGVLLSGAVGTGLVMSGGARRPDSTPRPTTSTLPSSGPRAAVSAVSGRFTSTVPTVESRQNPSATLLLDGRVLIVGGWNSGTTSEVFDPATGTFRASGDLHEGRGGHTAIRLNDGRVLVTGRFAQAAEVWDPATGEFTVVGTPLEQRESEWTSLLPDGRVLISGPGRLDDSGSATPETAETWDPSTGAFERADPIPGPPIKGAAVTVRLQDGRFLVINSSQARIWDPDTRTFTTTGTVFERRHSETATLLTDGRVLVAGGVSQQQLDHLLMVAEVWDPTTGMFAPTAMTAVQRTDHTAVLLADGRVLLVGNGRRGDDGSAEIFELAP